MPELEQLQKRLIFAEKIAIEAGAKALYYFNRRDTLFIETKAHSHDVVSIADKEVEQFLRKQVEEKFPDDDFVGEEYGDNSKQSAYTWVVDPIDGTSAFLAGIPNWCVSIAVIKNREPLVGIIYAPCLNEIYSGAKGLGASLNDKKLPNLGTKKNLINSGIGLTSASSKIVENLHEAGGVYLNNGSAALMVAYVAAGKLVGYYAPKLWAWDCMAGYCLVQEVGGYIHPFFIKNKKITDSNHVFACTSTVINDLKRIVEIY